MLNNFLKISLALLGCIFAELCCAKQSGNRGDLAVLRFCNASSPVSREAANSVLMYHNTNHPETRTPEFKCFLLCLYVEYGWMDRVGGFELHTIKSAIKNQKLTESQMEALIYKCTNMELTDPCERAFNYTTCFWAYTTVQNVLDAEFVEETTENSAEGFYLLD